MEHSHAYLFLLHWWLLLHYSSSAESLPQRRDDPQSLKYLLSSPLQKRLADFVHAPLCSVLCVCVSVCSCAHCCCHVCADRLLFCLSVFTVHLFPSCSRPHSLFLIPNSRCLCLALFPPSMFLLTFSFFSLPDPPVSHSVHYRFSPGSVWGVSICFNTGIHTQYLSIHLLCSWEGLGVGQIQDDK